MAFPTAQEPEQAKLKLEIQKLTLEIDTLRHPWRVSNVEFVKLAVGTATAVVVVFLTWLMTTYVKQYEAAESLNQKVVEKRIVVYDSVGPDLNDLYSYLTYVGGAWRELEPPQVLKKKRDLDKLLHVYQPLFPEFFAQADTFINACFKPFDDWPNNAKLRTSAALHKDGLEKGKKWKPEYDSMFADQAEVTDRETVDLRYRCMLFALSRELGNTKEPLPESCSAATK